MQAVTRDTPTPRLLGLWHVLLTAHKYESVSTARRARKLLCLCGQDRLPMLSLTFLIMRDSMRLAPCNLHVHTLSELKEYGCVYLATAQRTITDTSRNPNRIHVT